MNKYTPRKFKDLSGKKEICLKYIKDHIIYVNVIVEKN
jgi:hypothetical protein